MWYSQSEANYREAFRVAREAGEKDPDVPVVMFFDEVDAIGGARGAGGSLMRVDDRVLTAFLTELDGLESRGNVLVVCATNRRDALDPALLRSGGRLGDIVLEVPRPNRAAAREIFARHLPPNIPFAREYSDSGRASDRDVMIDSAVARIYGPNGHGELATVTLRDGKRHPVMPSDVVSGALIANIARRAIEQACFREVDSGDSGLMLRDVLEAVDAEFDTAARALTPGNCHRFLESLPQDVDVVRVERSDRPARRAYRYLSVA
jgi:proteasome-associated ATPase